MKTLKRTLMLLAVIILIGLMSCEKEPTTKCYTCTTTVQYNFLTNNNDGTWSRKYGTIDVINSTVFCDLTSGEAAIILPQYEKDNSKNNYQSRDISFLVINIIECFCILFCLIPDVLSLCS